MLFCPCLLSLTETYLDGFSRVIGEATLTDDKRVQIVSQEVSAGASTMAIVDAEEGADRPW